ncbi:MAG: PEP-CTERM sorting domain-containing protein [Phycisphaerales bacterium]|nr:PEP-CTERM sorting domain-containing protein [Phycisphaerales bacterium]
MKNAVALIAVAGIASVAAAQNFSLTVVPSATEVAEGGTFTLSVYGDSDQGSHLLGGEFSMSSGSALVDSMAWSNAAWSAFNTDNGYAGNGDYNSVIFGQLVIPGIFPPAPGSENGALIGTFQVNLAAAGTGVIDFQLNAGAGDFTLQTVDSVTGDLYDDRNGQLSLGSTRVTVTPAPSALALLGLGGIAAGRRRR